MKKHTKYKTLTTPFANEADVSVPWNEYPRPQLKRNSFICLNGKWELAITEDDRKPAEYPLSIKVPFPPESLLSGLERSVGAQELLHYRRYFSIPKDFNRGRVLLHFGAVDQICCVHLNGISLGEHIGGYTPFQFDITDALTDGENELCVTVKDELDLTLPYGKQRRKRGGMWYTPVSGIWQTVWLESVPENHIRRLIITPTLNSVTVRVDGGEGKKQLILDSGECFEFDGDQITVAPTEIRHWTPEDPYLYYFTLKCADDEVESYFALREIGVREVDGIPRICLNGKPYIFNGLLDQGYFPDGIFLPASSKGYEEDIKLAKRLGFNMLRKHIKLEPAVFYHLCDRLGMAVFQDMINNSDYSFIRDTALPTVGFKRRYDRFMHKSAVSRERFMQGMRELIKELQPYPSVLYYTVFNEGWGQFEADKTYRLARMLDPTRIIDATSGWFTRKESDVDSRHVYFKAIKLGRTSDRPIVISEFGGYSCRVEGHLYGDNNYGYSIYPTCEKFEDAFISLYEREVLPLAKQGVCAFVYTQISDIEDETNGLITYDRRVLKVNEEKIRNLMNKISGYIT